MGLGFSLELQALGQVAQKLGIRMCSRMWLIIETGSIMPYEIIKVYIMGWFAGLSDRTLLSYKLM